MELQEFKQEIRHHPKMAQDFLNVRLEELPESNLFKWLIHPDYDYHHVDVEFNRVRILNARQVEITDLAGVLDSDSDMEAVIAKVEPKQCFQNAWRLSLDFQWNYCEGFFIDVRYGHLIDHAWNKTKDGRYVDVTGEALPRVMDGDYRLVDTGAYVLCYEIPPGRLIELVREHSDKWIQFQSMSKVDWFTKHAPERLKKGSGVIRIKVKNSEKQA